MIIEYEISMDDILDFILYHHSHSPSWRRTSFMNRWLTPYLLGMFLLVVVVTSGLKSVLVLGLLCLIWLVFTIFWAMFLGPRCMLRHMKKQIVEMYGEGKRGSYIGKHRLTIASDGILDSTAYEDSKMYWKAVEKILSTDKHLFIYASATAAHIIPRRAFPDELKYREFVEAVKQSRESSVA